MSEVYNSSLENIIDLNVNNGLVIFFQMRGGQTIRPVVTQPTLVSTPSYVTGTFARVPGATISNRPPYMVTTKATTNRKPSATAVAMAKLGSSPQVINQIRDPKRKYDSLK